jgi:hypothetical protein
MSGLAEAILEEVERAAGVLHRMSEAEVTRSRGEGKWGRKQILGHLVDSAVNNHQRFVRAQSANPFVWPGNDQVASVALLGPFPNFSRRWCARGHPVRDGASQS